jgi:CheY-like chemotaxis protein
VTFILEFSVRSLFLLGLPFSPIVHILGFAVLLPAQDVQAVTLDATRSSSAVQLSLHGCRLLVVDDRPDELTLFSTVLEAEGAHVTTAANALAALAILQNDPPDVLVSDIAMPQADGYELLRLVRRLPPETGGKTPAIAVTAHARIEDRERALAAGFQAYVSKPVDPTKLVETVAAVAQSASRTTLD